VFEAAGDDRGLARAYRLRSMEPWMATRYAEMAAYGERSAEHARRAGDPGEQELALDLVAVALVNGPLSVSEGLRRFDALKGTGTRRELESGKAILLGMAGRFDESRRMLAEERAAFVELGRPAWAASVELARGAVELLAGEPVEAERALRRGREEFLRLGEKGVLSSLSAMLAQALCLQGRFEEAEPFIEESRELASSEDVYSQEFWRMAKALVLAGRRDLAQAERLAREAVDLANSGDSIDDQGEALSVLSQVVEAAGRADEAAALIEEAIDRHERKGNVSSASRARDRLTSLGEQRAP
jgi:tetratricopeptide (TPR) repeat protein